MTRGFYFFFLKIYSTFYVNKFLFYFTPITDLVNPNPDTTTEDWLTTFYILNGPFDSKIRDDLEVRDRGMAHFYVAKLDEKHVLATRLFLKLETHEALEMSDYIKATYTPPFLTKEKEMWNEIMEVFTPYDKLKEDLNKHMYEVDWGLRPTPSVETKNKMHVYDKMVNITKKWVDEEKSANDTTQILTEIPVSQQGEVEEMAVTP